MLKDLIPARYRKKVYAVVTLLATVYGIWEASNGDWHQFVASVLTAATTALATANTDGPLLKRGEGGASVVQVLAVVALVLVILLLLGHRVHVG